MIQAIFLTQADFSLAAGYYLEKLNQAMGLNIQKVKQPAQELANNVNSQIFKEGTYSAFFDYILLFKIEKVCLCYFSNVIDKRKHIAQLETQKTNAPPAINTSGKAYNAEQVV